MEVLLANPRGFCAGVTRAIETVYQTLNRYGAPVYVLHEIVHNRHVLANLRAEGAIFVKHLREIPAGGITIFSAHGVSSAMEREAASRGLITVDATCPLVSRIHRRVGRLDREGYEIVIIGHAGHPEVEGTRGRGEGEMHVVSRIEEVDDLVPSDPNKVAYATQTTLSLDDSEQMVKALRRRFPMVNGPATSDICYATQNRQNAVRELAGKVEVLLVVGSKNSSNSNRLREVGAMRGIVAYLIDDASEIDPAWLLGVERVGITAGASAPEVLVREVLAWLRGHGATTVREMEGQEENVYFQAARLPDEGEEGQ